MRIYIAAPLAAAVAADSLAYHLGRLGHIIVSGWHFHVGPNAVDPEDDEARAVIARDNSADLDKAEGLIALTHFPDFEGRWTYGEIGYALGRGLPVAWVQDGARGRCSGDAHALVQRFQHAELAPRPEVVLADWARLHDAPAPAVSFGERGKALLVNVFKAATAGKAGV